MRFGIPRIALEALLEGLEWDVEGRVYETVCDVYEYAARVAGSVGVMMAALMDARTPDLVARACDLGVAMQLTNIARDVGEDARAGRLYLPRTWLRQAGVDPDVWLRDPVFTPEIGAVVDRLLRHADELYARADRGIANLNPRFRPAIFAARRLYAEIGARLRRRGLDSVSVRTSVPVWRKAQLVASAVSQASQQPAVTPEGAPLEQTRYLIDALVSEGCWPALSRDRTRKGVKADAEWIIDLFATLEVRGRMVGPAR